MDVTLPAEPVSQTTPLTLKPLALSAPLSYKDSNFSVHKSKLGTGRVVAWREMSIINALTLEASFCSAGINDEQKMLAAALNMDTGAPTGASAAIILFVARLAVRVEALGTGAAGHRQAHLPRQAA